MRPVPFARPEHSQIQWGFTFNRAYKTAAVPGPTAGNGAAMLAPGLRINAFATHVWTLSSNQLIRTGLPVVDVLAGGASADGSTRNVVQFGGGAALNGMGVQLSGSLFGPRRISAGTLASPERIYFAVRAQLDLRLFANLGTLLPQSAVGRGARVTIEVDNLLNSKQRVTDQQGRTPERYQSALLDPVGRRIMLKLRKVF